MFKCLCMYLLINIVSICLLLYMLLLAVIPCLLPLRAERKWSAETCWTPNGGIGLRWPNLTSEEYQLEAMGRGGSSGDKS